MTVNRIHQFSLTKLFFPLFFPFRHLRTPLYQLILPILQMKCFITIFTPFLGPLLWSCFIFNEVF
eukprot:UN18752